MKKSYIFVLLCVFFVLPVMAQSEETTELVDTVDVIDESRTPHEVGIYFKDYFPVARMHNHSYNFIGAGLSYAYHSPLKVPMPKFAQKFTGAHWNVGFSGRFDVVGSYANDEYVNRWFTMNLFAGAFMQWVYNSWFEIQPSLEYGLQFDSVHSDRDANGMYVNQGIQFSPTFKFRPNAINKDGLSIEVSPIYTLGFEPDGVANYFGLRVGCMYKIGGKFLIKNSDTEVVTKIEYVDREIIKEVPVEVVKEVEVIKEVIKEVPVYIEKENVTPDAPEPEPEEENVPEVAEKVEINLREDGSVDIAVPNLMFVSNSTVLTSAVENKETIQKVYEILSDEKYLEFNCVITGFVNPDGDEWTAEEKKLAKGRAESVVKELVNLGIDENRLTAEFGSGKTSNKEYNRRVEFKLQK